MHIRLALLGLVALVAACAAPGPAPTPSPTSSASASPSATPAPSPSPAAGLYLRAWQTQALPPEHTLSWLPTLTISGNVAIDGNVAIPMIFPGPLMIMPNARQISPQGQASIVELARQLGLLDGATDFTEGGLMPGGMTAHVLLTIDGQTVELVGDPNATGRCAPGDMRCPAEPATAEAFAFFWARLSYLDDWLGHELSGPLSYQPERLVVVTTPPSPMDVPLTPAAWPLDVPLADFGEPWAIEGSRCAVVEGEQLETLLPALLAANQATVFVDTADESRAILARVLVPGEPSPCHGAAAS